MFSASELDVGDQRQGPVDPGLAENVLLRRLTLDEGGARRRGRLEALGIPVDDHVFRTCGTQVSHNLAADPAEATDEVMAREGVDHPLPPALVEEAGDVPGNEELCHCDQRVEEGTDAEHDQQHLEHLPAGRLG